MQADDVPAITPPILTDHARKRAQARGVPMRILEAIYSNADRSPFVGSGCRSLMVSRRQLARLDGSIPAADRERPVSRRWSSRREMERPTKEIFGRLSKLERQF